MTTAFAPLYNDFEKGGRSFKVDCTQAGRMVKAVQDSFKRFNRADGRFHYPKIPENRLRVEGELYFQSWEIGGSCEQTKTKEGKKNKLKFSLLKYFKERLMDRKKATAQMVEELANKRIHGRFQ